MKRALFCLVGISLTLVWIELLSLAVYRVSEGRAVSFSALQRERAELQAEAPGERLDGQPPDEVIHPYLGFVFNPEANGGWLQRSHNLFRSLAVPPVGVSPYGFIDDKSPIQARSRDRVIIGVFGGSMAMWLSLLAKDTLVSELRRAPRFRHKDIVLVRAALGGYKQPQQLLTLSYLLSLGGAFDVAVNLDGFNEVVLPVVENLPKHVFPFYPRLWFWRAQPLPNHSALLIMGEVTLWQARRARLARTVSATWLRHSVTVNVMWKLADRYLENEINRRAQRLLALQGRTESYVVSGPPDAYDGTAAAYRGLAEFWKRASIQMHRIARANGIAYYHFLQPNQYVAGSKRLSASERRIAVDERSPMGVAAREGYPYLRSAGAELRKEGEEFFDLTGLFRSVEGDIYIDPCCHVNSRGNAMLAAAIAGKIVEGER